MDQNKVILTGVAISDPIATKLPSGTAFSSFGLGVTERFRTQDGTEKARSNVLRIEAFGKNADKVMQLVKRGARYAIEGFLREENAHISVRVFMIAEDPTADALAHKQSIKAAIAIVERSQDRDTAIKNLEAIA